MNEIFRRFSCRTSEIVGSSWAFLIAVATLVIWVVTGPMFHYSNTWQLIINTGTTIVTFLMVFLIQNTQNRDAAAIHLKLDELIRSAATARDSMIDVEDLSDEELKKLQASFRALREREEGMQESLGVVEDVVSDELKERTGTRQTEPELSRKAG